MSQPQTLPITATRWLSLLLCAITAAIITVFLSKVGFVQKAYASWGAILNTNPVIHYSSAFLAGIGIKLLLDKFYISHPKRGIGFSWRYPPVTIAVWLSVAALLVYLFVNAAYRPYFLDDDLLFSSLKYVHITLFSSALFALFQEPKDKAKKLNSKSWFILFTALVILLLASGFYHTPWPLITTFTLLYCFAVILRLLANNEIKQPHSQSSSVEANTGDGLNDLDDFREWFKDDSIIKNTEELEPDLQVYAKRITERLQNGGDKDEKDLAQHIALCGPYGCGKSSIVESIVNDLAKSSEKESIWIHSDISTWGAESGSVAHVVLSHIIDDISQHIDMCAFRALPKHYTEALKSGGSAFQFASTLLAGPVDIEGSFQKLNDVLDATNHKLLITLQDVDRGTGDENEKRLNDIAALLDRLKNRDLSHINFIVAMGNENEVAAEVISKATDYREDIIFSNFSVEKIERFILVMIEEAEKKGVVVFNDNMDEFRDAQGKSSSFIANKSSELELISNYLTTFRVLKKVLRRAHEAWTSNDGLMGEVNIYALLILYTLREKEVKVFYRFQHFFDTQNYILMKTQDLKGSLGVISKNDESIYLLLKELFGIIEIDGKYYFDSIKDYLQMINSPKYLHRALNQNVEKIDSDQNFIKTLKGITQSKDLLSFVKYWLETNSFASEDGVAQFIFCDLESGKLDSSLFYDYKIAVEQINDTPTRRVAFYIASRLTIESIVDIELFLSNSSEDTTCIKTAKHRLRVALIEVLTGNYERRFSEIFSKTFEEQLPEGLYAFTRAAYDSVKFDTGINADIALPKNNYRNSDLLERQIRKLIN